VTPLGEELRLLIETNGPIPFDRFMELSLSHPKYGYYLTRDPFGAAGDFVTAPEISQMFGELIGLWAAQVWTQMDRPARVRLVELGPGRGSLMADALRACRVMPEFLEAADICLVETSPVLRDVQRKRLSGAASRVAWYDALADVPPGPSIVIANEFFDALPVRHFVRTEEGWCEKLVGVDEDGQLFIGLDNTPETALRVEADVGETLEIGASAHRAMAELAARLVSHGGAALVVDYGHTKTALGETVQALWRHEAVDPLEAPGECDVTAHVDFASLSRAAAAMGARVSGPLAQGVFLERLGIHERARVLLGHSSEAQAADIESAVDRLTATEQRPGAGGRTAPGMGALFKALAVTSHDLPMPPGFEPPPEP
jgi:SAM-dependent MidA family methyltransferase